MLNHKLIFCTIFLLVLVLIGGGLLQIYHVMGDTTGRPVPALWEFRTLESKWEIAILGSHYSLSKDKLRLDNLQENTRVLVKKVADQGNQLWQKIFELLEVTGEQFDEWRREKK